MRIRPLRPLVLQLITTLDPGGAEHQLLTLIRRLRDRFDFQVAYLKGAGGLAQRFEALGVPVSRLGIHRWADPVCLVRLVRLIRGLRPDLIVTHLFKADVYGAMASIGTDIPLVSHKHNEDQFLLNPLFGALGLTTASRCRRLVAVSDAVARFHTDRAGFPEERFVRVLHGIEGEPPGLSPTELRRRFDVEEDSLLLGTAARLTPQKGLDTLIRAVKRLIEHDDRFRFTCLIAGVGEDRDGLTALCRSLGLEERVRLVGRVTDIPAFLQALDIFILPSRWEGLGVVLLEAMANGCPIVASRVGGIPEVIEDGRTGRLVPPDDPCTLAAAVMDLARDRSHRMRLARAGRSAFERRFTATRMAEEIAAVYEGAMALQRDPV